MKAILGKVFELQKAIGTIRKDAKNKGIGYQYASAKHVNEIVGDKLTELGLVAQTDVEASEVLPGGLVVSRAILTLYDVESGEAMSFSGLGSGIDPGDKAAAKADTMATKYATLKAAFAATEDDPEADAKTDMRGQEKPASVRSNRPATALPAPVVPPPVPADTPGAAAMQQGPVDMGGGVFAVTVQPGEVYDGRPTKSGKTGPGTVLGTNGVRYDTFDTGLLDTAKKAKAEGKLVNVMYVVDAKWNRNKIVEHGLGVFGEVAEEPAEAENY